MKQILTFCLLIMAATCLNAQTIKGILKDADTGEALPYVNIGVLNKNIGTVSADDGSFSLPISAGHDADTLRISTLGYANRDIIVAAAEKQFAANPVLKLQPEAIQLQQVVVSNKPPKERVLGNKTESKNTTVGFTSNVLGNELGMIMKIKKSPTQLKTFTASLASDNNPNAKLRLNFYTAKKGLPDVLLNTQNIIVTAPASGKLVVDLLPYNIMIDDDVFVTLEWLESFPQGLKFSAGLLATPMVARSTSQAQWEKISMVGIGFTLTTIHW
ncbi:carboxypeptidase-like regulatory domain-containing protein [Flavobacterium subsaxonicum]|uniref:Carboxypeptidase-like regulatory domain-containing protein n=1 Tax=Flavobacterium subsaxonicum WB 4.1-42 = DSM 21790 TaxID=1121898 RepID=A0A0A2MEE7_9FLAO|nr:carboxypeptidase-like regulatory domain-containing protein [Flavobacterium subsaxonicum]KGO91062.1 hypothetical protein Q766_19855 [Flavobacterium subsaxonicum WB 4.1-42 = DSM 21790]